MSWVPRAHAPGGIVLLLLVGAILILRVLA
jgi:hypothetical protein